MSRRHAENAWRNFMAWSEEDERYGRKVGYWKVAPARHNPGPSDVPGLMYRSTAYLKGELAADVYWGTNKHSDYPVVVRWDETHERYVEVEWACPRWMEEMHDPLDVVVLDGEANTGVLRMWVMDVPMKLMRPDGVLVFNAKAYLELTLAKKRYDAEMAELAP